MDVLLVDDDKHLLRQAQRFFGKRSNDFTIDTVTSTKVALENLYRKEYDAIVSDDQLSGKNGLQLLKKLRERGNTTPFLFFPKTCSEDFARKALNLGANKLITKTETPRSQFQRLAKAIKEEVDLAQQRERNNRNLSYSTLRNRSEYPHDKFSSITEDILECVNYGILVLDSNFTIIWVNHFIEEYFDLILENILGKNKKKLINKHIKHQFEHPQQFEQKLLSTYENNSYINSFECHILPKPEKEKEERWLQHWSAPIQSGPLKGGRVETYIDITEQKRMEQKTKKARKKYQTLFNSINDAIFLHTLDGEFIAVNKTAVQRLEYPEQELLKKSIYDIDTSKHAQQYPQRIQKLKKYGTLTFEATHISRNGEKIPVEISATLIKRDNRPLVLSVARDITRRKKAEKREEFLHSILRHDVQNNVQIIRGYLQLLEKEVTGKPQEYVQEALHVTQQSYKLIEKVRTLRRLNKIEIEPIPLDPFLRDVIENIKERAHEKKMKVQYEGCSCWVKAGSLLKEALKNLLENAIIHSGGTQIEVRVNKHSRKVEVQVTDDGSGIPEKWEDKIFTHGFARGETAGSGIGLYLVKRIIDTYDGSVDVGESQWGGACFTLQLQRAKPEKRKTNRR